MKTTFDLPDTLYRRVKIRAAERGTTVRELVIESLQRGLASDQPGEPLAEPARGRYCIVDDLGWPVLDRPAHDPTVVTDQYIDRLREQEGI